MRFENSQSYLCATNFYDHQEAQSGSERFFQTGPLFPQIILSFYTAIASIDKSAITDFILPFRVLRPINQ